MTEWFTNYNHYLLLITIWLDNLDSIAERQWLSNARYSLDLNLCFFGHQRRGMVLILGDVMHGWTVVDVMVTVMG